jgi:hypothetical protein
MLTTDGSRAANEDGIQQRLGRGALSRAEMSEIQKLYCQMAHTCDIACESMGRATAPTDSELSRFKEMTARVTAAIARINEILR